MWILTPLQPGGETHYLQLGKNYVVGRKNCDILLPKDQSISRAHAHISTTEQTLTLKDTSKYGTFVNGQQLSENSPVNLTSGCDITFGVFNSKFRLEPLKPVVCSSCLDDSGKASLSEALKLVGGKLVGTWSQDCTHLVMSKVKVTIKTICALLSGRPIVKPEFFSALQAAVQKKSPTPEPDRFIPEINEPSLNKDKVKIGVIPKRRELFAGKTFVFLNAKQRTRLSAVVTCGGGSCRLLDEGSLPRDVLESAQSCVIDVTSSASQTVLSSSTVDWVNSVKSIVEKKGLRVITESEIGLAAIYASCDTHCNPSHLTHSDSLPKMKSRIPSASLSQSLAVEETVLPGPSMNITAYAANTEPSQGVNVREVSGVSAVGETPEKRLKTKNPGTEKKTESPCFVAESHNSSFNVVEQTESKQTVEESKLTEEEHSGVRQQQPVFAKPNGGTRMSSQKQTPQKTNTFGQGSPKKLSPQKQSSLTSFFQPVNKKRQLEEDINAETSQPKRPARDSSMNSKLPETFKETRSEKDSSQISRGATENKAQGQKRKEIESEIELEELESLMSEDMDFDEPPPRSQSQAKVSDPKPQKDVCKVEVSSKRPRLQEKDKQDSWKSQQFDLEKPSTSRKTSTVKIKEQNISINIDAFEHSEEKSDDRKSNNLSTKTPAVKKQNRPPFTENGNDFVEDEELLQAEASEVPVKPAINKQELKKSSAPPGKVPAVKNQSRLPFDDGDSDFVEDEELLKAESIEVAVKPPIVKPEVKEPKVADSLPKNLLLVEFRDLKMSEPPTKVTKPKQSNGCTKNFKCFHKVQMRGVTPVIRGADLLAHNRGRNSDLDEWLKDAAEEELQNRRDESAGDDLFRYNPSKLTRRR